MVVIQFRDYISESKQYYYHYYPLITYINSFYTFLYYYISYLSDQQFQNRHNYFNQINNSIQSQYFGEINFLTCHLLQLNKIISIQHNSRIMKIFFWDFCETDDCIRQWIFFIITWLIFCFTIYSVINTYRFYKRITIEMLPLTVNCLATALIISLQMFQRGFEYHLVTYLIEIYTYFLFCFTFITMYINANNISEKISRVLNIIFLVFSLFIVVLVTIVFLKAIIPSCQNVFTIQFYLFFITECILYFLTLAFGILIFRALRNTEKIQRNLRNLKGESFRDVLLEDQYFKEKIKQILIIQISYTITIALRIISIILNNIFSQQIHCTYIDQAYVQGSDQTLGKVLIIINNIIQLVPHLLLPIAVYIIPSTRRMNTLLILEEQDKQQNQLGSINFKKQQLLKKNISSLVLSNDNSNN